MQQGDGESAARDAANPVTGGLSDERLDAARQTQKSGQLPAAELAHAQQCFGIYAAAGAAVERDDLWKVVCEMNGGLAPGADEWEVLKRLCYNEAALGGKGTGVTSEHFVAAVTKWYQGLGRRTGEQQPQGAGTPVAAVDEPLALLSGAADQQAAAKEPDDAAADDLGSHEQALVLATFKRYSKRQDGCIFADELREMMADLSNGVYPSDAEVQHVMWFADTSQNGYLSVSEFESAVTFWYIHTMDAREQAKAHCCVVL